MAINLLFPTMVMNETYSESENFKNLVFKNILNLCTEDGRSHEKTGHVTIHHTQDFFDFYKFAIKMAKKYVESLHIDPEIFEYNIVKSWFNITNNNTNPRHNHSDAHLTFSYCVNTPSNCKKAIRFFNPGNKINSLKSPNDLFPGMIEINSNHFDYANSLHWSFETTEGEIFLWPASLDHSVVNMNNENAEQVDLKEEFCLDMKQFYRSRIVIAGDILITYKNKQPVYLGLQPKENWRTFE